MRDYAHRLFQQARKQSEKFHERVRQFLKDKERRDHKDDMDERNEQDLFFFWVAGSVAQDKHEPVRLTALFNESVAAATSNARQFFRRCETCLAIGLTHFFNAINFGGVTTPLVQHFERASQSLLAHEGEGELALPAPLVPVRVRADAQDYTHRPPH